MLNRLNKTPALKEYKNKVRDIILNKHYNNILKELNIKAQSESNPIIYVIGAPEHGNLGDHAIIDAELNFLRDQFPNISRVEIPYRMIFMKLPELKSLIKPKDIVCITGGGYMGSLWKKAEKFIRIIIENFSDNKIIMFPQTVYYELHKPDAQEYFEESIKVYNSHDNLTLTAREEASYDFFTNHYPNANNLLTPDIGLYLNETDTSKARDGILVCLRSDREKVTNTDSIKSVIEKLSSKHDLEVSVTDTVLQRPVFKRSRDKFLQKKLDEFRTSKIVITDRLHGMVFAAITGTPCIAMDNKTKKVKGVYKWIEDQNYVTLLEDVSQLEQEFEKLLRVEKPKYQTDEIYEGFKPLIETFKK